MPARKKQPPEAGAPLATGRKKKPAAVANGDEAGPAKQPQQQVAEASRHQ